MQTRLHRWLYVCMYVCMAHVFGFLRTVRFHIQYIHVCTLCCLYVCTVCMYVCKYLCMYVCAGSYLPGLLHVSSQIAYSTHDGMQFLLTG